MRSAYIYLMEHYAKNVSHRPLDHSPTHISYRLAGSLPKAIVEKLKHTHLQEKEALKNRLQDFTGRHYEEAYREEMFLIDARFELATEEALHTIKHGPYHLENELVANEVINSWCFLKQKGLVYVYAICVMSNHVHVILRAPEGEDSVPLGPIMSRHKTFTSKACKQVLNLPEGPFWHARYFDLTVRRGKFERVMWYVLNNPVKAGLVNDWRGWPATYLNPDYDLLFR